jgi:hypothetical protein
MDVVATAAKSPSFLSDMCQIGASSYRPSRRLRDLGAHNCVTIPGPFSLVGVAGFEPATTRTPSVNAGFSTVILRIAQYTPSSSLSVGICSFNPDISAYWRTRNSSESPHKSPHSLRRANDNPDPRFLSPFVPRSAPPRGYIWRDSDDRTPSNLY